MSIALQFESHELRKAQFSDKVWEAICIYIYAYKYMYIYIYCVYIYCIYILYIYILYIYNIYAIYIYMSYTCHIYIYLIYIYVQITLSSHHEIDHVLLPKGCSQHYTTGWQVEHLERGRTKKREGQTERRGIQRTMLWQLGIEKTHNLGDIYIYKLYALSMGP